MKPVKHFKLFSHAVHIYFTGFPVVVPVANGQLRDSRRHQDPNLAIQEILRLKVLENLHPRFSAELDLIMQKS